jgi:hypothetical protein
VLCGDACRKFSIQESSSTIETHPIGFHRVELETGGRQAQCAPGAALNPENCSSLVALS